VRGAGRLVIVVALCAPVAACAGELLVPDERAVAGLPEVVPQPADNPTTSAKVELGRALFWDPILSGERDVACATCHHPDLAYADGRAISVGVGGRGLGAHRDAGGGGRGHQTNRSSMTILNSAFNGLSLARPDTPPETAPMFWDNRARSLEEQALMPIRNREEMRGDRFGEDEILLEVIGRLQRIPGYVERFERAFGGGPITDTNLSRALAAFERTLVNRMSSFDRFMAGDDRALSHSAKRGLAAFVSDGCTRCHSGPMFSDFKLHRLNVPGAEGDRADDGTPRMRTPSLRNVSKTAPYMRNGSLKTLAEVLDFYTARIDTSLDPDLPDRFPHREVEVFEAFFQSLSDGEFDRTVPTEVPSGLPPGGAL
jgi:cytochrome c peroxidase